MHVHFDGDLLVYRCGFAAEKQLWDVIDSGGGCRGTFPSKREATALQQELISAPDELDDGFEVCKGDRELEPLEYALANVRTMVDKALDSLSANPSEMTMYLSGKGNYREGVATIKVYKGNRDPDHKPTHGPAIKEYMEKKYNVVYSEDEEADDVVAYSHYAMWLQDEHSSVIATVDKDLDMIPGLHYNFVKDESYYVTPEAADKWFYLQLLMGDATDNIPGLPMVGPKTASRMLEDCGTVDEYFAVALDAYEQAYEDGLAALIENARLLWIRRAPNEWWVPPHANED